MHTMRRLAEIASKSKTSLYTCLVDLKKAFDWVHRPALWHILERYGVSPTELEILKDLHTDNRGKVRIDGECTDEFSMNVGVRQGCILAAPIFAAFIDFIMRTALNESTFPRGIRILYNGDKVLGDWKGCTLEEFIWALAYADDIILIAENAKDLENMLLTLENVTQAWGLIISVAKTKVLIMGEDAKTAGKDINITIRGEKVEVVQSAKYLGSILT